MVVLDISLDNFYAFKNFHMNMTYPKKIVGSSIKEEHLAERPNFRYKKVNIIMGANATGKTSLCRALMKIFNFITNKNYEMLVEAICDRTQPASFVLDLAFKSNIFYRVHCVIAPCEGDSYTVESVKVEVRKTKILAKDSYESCAKRISEMQYVPDGNYIEELEKVEALAWMFEYPKDSGRMLKFPEKDPLFATVLEIILKALDPSIQAVEPSRDVEKAYVIRLQDKSVILQDGTESSTPLLSSGTKSGVEVAQVVSAMMQGSNSFYYCDEKFTYVHSDIEMAILSLMIDYIQPNDQLFFTTHNTEVLNMNLPKHSFTFLRKDMSDTEHPITCVDASSMLKRNTDSLKNAVENDLFSCAPSVDLIYAIADL